MKNIKPESLKPHSWYWSKSLKKGVKFVEICGVGNDRGKLYVEFQTEQNIVGGAYVLSTDLYENWFDAAMDAVYES